LGAELIPEALEPIFTAWPTRTAVLVIVTIPTLTCSASPSIVIEDLPTVSTPITLASPSTIKVVLPVPMNTVPTPLVSPMVVTPDNIALRWIFKSPLPVIIPTESTLVTSSYVIVPATDILPVISVSPWTNNALSDLATEPIPIFFTVLIPTESTAQVPADPTDPPVFSIHVWLLLTYSLPSEGASSIPPPPNEASCCWTLLTNNL